MDRIFTYMVADLAFDEALALRRDCRVRIFDRADLAALVGRDARLQARGITAGVVVPGLRRTAFHRLGRGSDSSPTIVMTAGAQLALAQGHSSTTNAGTT